MKDHYIAQGILKLFLNSSNSLDIWIKQNNKETSKSIKDDIFCYTEPEPNDIRDQIQRRDKITIETIKNLISILENRQTDIIEYDVSELITYMKFQHSRLPECVDEYKPMQNLLLNEAIKQQSIYNVSDDVVLNYTDSKDLKKEWMEETILNPDSFSGFFDNLPLVQWKILHSSKLRFILPNNVFCFEQPPGQIGLMWTKRMIYTISPAYCLIIGVNDPKTYPSKNIYPTKKIKVIDVSNDEINKINGIIKQHADKFCIL